MSVLLAGAALSLGQASALNIFLDYSLDTFGFASKGGGAAKAAIDRAAADISDVLSTSLTQLDQTSFTASGSTVNITHSFTHPSSGVSGTSYDPVTNPIAANTVVIYVGARTLGGTTLGQGGPSSSHLGGSGLDFGPAAALANTHVSRSGGPVIGHFSKVGGSTEDINVGSTVGNLWFDIDTDNSGGIDSDAELEAFWHFDHTTGPAGGKYDLYSVAAHEMLHAIGIGASKSWDDNASGNDWLGANAIALNGGSGVGMLNGGHIASSINSNRLSDGVSQQTLMADSITPGTRKELTEMDVAFLQDIGWSVPEPSTAVLLGAGFFGLCFVRRRAA